MGTVTRLRATRVLVAGSDRRYLRAALAVLSQNGCAAYTIEKASELRDAADRFRPDVIVVDATGAVGRTVRIAAALDASEPDIEVVLVADGADAGRCGAQPKWEALEDLACTFSGLGGARVERA